jgi:hypothetical protein
MQFRTVSKKLPTVSSYNRLSKKHKITAAGATAAAAVVLSVVALEATAGASSATAAPAATAATHAATTGFDVSAGQPVKQLGTRLDLTSHSTIPTAAPHTVQLAAAKKPAADTAAQKAAAKKHAEAKAAADRSAKRAPVKHHAPAHKAHKAAKHTAAPKYANNLDGWIRQSLAIMHSKGIPGSYEGIHRNILRESSGNPKAINLWDINARNGIPSKGLLQMINPTFDRYHVAGTSWNIYNPVSNITAACNYAADRYGTMDNVNSAY